MAIVRPMISFGRSVSFGHGAGVLTLVMDWDARFRARRALAELGPERRADLGLDPAAIAAETAKPFWRP
jgi:uncharacterized protein YjiS (DUF1127 family)